MAQTPHRPFIPQRTPSAARQAGAAGAAEFKLARPFVRGAAPAARATTQRPAAAAVPPIPAARRPDPPPLPLVYDPPVEATATAEPTALQSRELDAASAPNAFVTSEALASIDAFVHTGRRAQGEPSDIDYDSYELPPVEHFIDSAPEGGAITSVGTGGPMAEIPENLNTDLGLEAAEWGETDWQHYDWRSAAALGDAADPEANSAWSETDWENAPAPMREVRETAAKAIADALDGIARRIRDGELVIPPPGGDSNPAAIAATLAALLGVRR